MRARLIGWILLAAQSLLLGAAVPAAFGADRRQAPVAKPDAEARKLEETLRARELALDSLLNQLPGGPDSLLEPETVDEIEKMRQEAERSREEAVRHAQEALRHAREMERRHLPRPPGHRKTVAYNMFRFGEDVTVRPGEVVQGDAVIVAGSLWVEGEVDGDAVVLGGNLNVGRDAVIRGQALSIGGRVDTSPGAQIEGQTVGLTLLPRNLSWFSGPWPRWFSLLADVIKIGFLMLIAGLLLAMVPDRLARAEQQLCASFPKCFGVGLLVLTGGFFAVIMSAAVLAITIIGLPAALLVVFATGVMLVASLLVGVRLIGDRMAVALRLPSGVPWISVLLGLILVLLPEIVADLLHPRFPFTIGRFWLTFLSWALVTAAVASGLGALVLSKLGAARAGQAPQPAH